ncbi:F-box associated interaction domain [Arabidopsis thaliana x Arabidopsis arenosa]|uniref:F-box associated interaction domain n=1 Tax=Arabidopsis thaliana x Arabidopsis arenosa TaxID=1240361 RepID=A0A8T1YT12_9BRAS|nr:F-box associated interaction domain [Arabidopsis thaliana x Arabidopsis arenosa]
MSCSARLKTSLGMTSALSGHEVLNSNDTMCEILLLLPPETIYKLILVSKRWLQIVASPYFRHTYLAKWNPSFELIGFLVCSSTYLGRRVDGARRPRAEPSLPLLSTSSIGDEIESSGILKKLGYYIDSSDGLLLCGRHPKAYYLWDPSTQKQQQLPRPRVHFEELCMSLITEDCPDKGFSYKVIRAESVGFTAQSTKLKVETFSSKTSTWSYSELTCPEPISLSPWTLGRVIKGVVYWHARGGKVAMYDSNSEEKRVDMIKLPKTYDYDEQVLGETIDGCLQYGWSNKSVMEVWKLEKVNDVLQWNILFKLNFKAMWKMNSVEATRYSVRTKETQLLAFLNQKSDSVFIRCETHIFIYDTETKRVEVVQYQGRKSTFVWDYCKVVPYFRRTWPCSPLFENNVMMIDTPQCNASSAGSN